MWTPAQSSRILRIAREAIASDLGFCEEPHLKEDWLKEMGACFVTVYVDDELNGCIGSIERRRSLYDDIVENARVAAFEDHRFPPITERSYPHMRLEVSVLSPLEEIQFKTEEDALAQLNPGLDGVVFQSGHRRSTFLPQVWEKISTPRIFLNQLKRKAGLSDGFWDENVRLWRYNVEKFLEEKTTK